MPMTRIVRTHLVYQFIILTLLFVVIGYYELLLERRFVMFLLVVPTFLYQLVILSCCTELIPIPGWINLSDLQERRNENATSNMIGTSQLEEDNCKNKTDKSMLSPGPNNLSTISCDQKVRTRKYEFKKCKAFSSNPGNSILQSPSTAITNGLTSSRNRKDFSFGCNSSDQIQSSEPTKRYFFPYRQKRLEQWIESKENSRPYKIRNFQSHINDSGCDSMPDLNSAEVSSTKNTADSSLPECSSVSTCSVTPESELTKRYTFPFRQKREPFIESDNEIDDSTTLPSTPYWHTVGYSVAVKQEARRRRRSVSSSLLTTRQNDFGKFESERCKDFSQSVEISHEPNDFLKENSLKTASPITTTFGKMKVGIVNCFSKIKRDHSKAYSDKESSSKKRTFKSIFQSRENINSELVEKEQWSNSKDKNEQPCDFYPTYFSFQNERFESDVRKRLLELPREK